MQATLEAMGVADGQPMKDANVNTYVGAVKSLVPEQSAAAAKR